MYYAWAAKDGALYFLKVRTDYTPPRDLKSVLATAWAAPTDTYPRYEYMYSSLNECTPAGGVAIADWLDFYGIPNAIVSGCVSGGTATSLCSTRAICPPLETSQAPSNPGPAMIESAVGAAPGAKKLYIAWTGTDASHTLNITSSSDQGLTWTKLWPPLPEYSVHAPALCEYRGRLYIAWTGTDGRLNVSSSADGTTFSGKVILTGPKSDASPALAVIGGQLALGWKPEDKYKAVERLHVLFSPDGVTFDSEWTSPDGAVQNCVQGPALAGGLTGARSGYIAWHDYYWAGGARIGLLGGVEPRP
jgi:hypothetical protein